MKLYLYRKKLVKNSVGGKLQIREFSNLQYECATLEDEIEKIPAGDYKLRIRGEGGFHNRYSKRFSFHKGMIEIIVEGRKYILFHCGNTDEDTEGCVLVGTSFDEKTGILSQSVKAYEIFYPLVIKELLKGEEVKLHVQDIEEPKIVSTNIEGDKASCRCPHCGKEIVINVTK